MVARKLLTTPKGVRDILPREAVWRRELEARINKVFVGYGYREVVTPTIERLEVFSKGSELDEKMYKFVDRDGEILALRTDMTTPIARIVCGRLPEEKPPIRLCYSGNLFRYDDPQAGRKREFYQAGVEMIGDASPEADAEVIAIAYHSLQAAGVEDFRIDLGHVGYVHGLLAEAALNEACKDRIRKCLMHKDLVGLEETVRAHQGELGQDLMEIFLRLPTLRGGMEVLQQAESLTKNPLVQQALENMAEIFTVLKWYGIEESVTIDLSMIKKMHYYTGMIMEGYSKELGYDLCSGGRYNNLLAAFGSDLPATGFALGLDRVLLVMERQKCSSLTKQSVFRFCSPGGWNARRIQWIMKRREEGINLETLNDLHVNPEELRNVFAFVDDERIVWYGEKEKEEFDLDGAVLFMTLHSLEG